MIGMIGMIQLLRDTLLDSGQSGYVDAQEFSAEALLAVLTNLLHFSTLAAGEQRLERAAVDLLPVVQEACQMLAAQAYLKGLTISHTVDPGVPVAARTDRARLLQILLNLVRAAVNSTDSGEIVCTSAPVSTTSSTSQSQPPAPGPKARTPQGPPGRSRTAISHRSMKRSTGSGWRSPTSS
jgi:signal transduction histidine kinase